MSRKVIKEFYESAKRYCDFVSNNVITNENIEELMYLMLDSFTKGLLLPDVEAVVFIRLQWKNVRFGY